jgi:hypothetical protein
MLRGLIRSGSGTSAIAPPSRMAIDEPRLIPELEPRDIPGALLL